MEEKQTQEMVHNTSYLKDIWSICLQFIIVIAIALFIHVFVGTQVEVSGDSMQNTLMDQDHLFLEKLSYRFDEPKRFDIVVFRPDATDKDLYYIKRIIGLPGETVQIDDGNIYINGEVIEENYGKEKMVSGGLAKEIITLADDEYFVLGDNRNNSKDSRYEEVGNVKKNSILGRAFLRIWPLNEIEILKHQ